MRPKSIVYIPHCSIDFDFLRVRSINNLPTVTGSQHEAPTDSVVKPMAHFRTRSALKSTVNIRYMPFKKPSLIGLSDLKTSHVPLGMVLQFDDVNLDIIYNLLGDRL